MHDEKRSMGIKNRGRKKADEICQTKIYHNHKEKLPVLNNLSRHFYLYWENPKVVVLAYGNELSTFSFDSM